MLSCPQEMPCFHNSSHFCGSKPNIPNNIPYTTQCHVKNIQKPQFSQKLPGKFMKIPGEILPASHHPGPPTGPWRLGASSRPARRCASATKARRTARRMQNLRTICPSSGQVLGTGEVGERLVKIAIYRHFPMKSDISMEHHHFEWENSW